MTRVLNFDLDNTLANRTPGLFTRVNDNQCQEFPDASLSKELFEDYDFIVPGTESHPDADGEGIGIGPVINHYLTTDESYIMEMPPLDGAVEAVRDLYAKDGTKIKIVTHRPVDAHDWSKQWLDEHDIPYDTFVEDVPHDKSEVSGDVLVDDAVHNIENMATSGNTAIGIIQRYSLNRFPPHANIVTAATLTDKHPEHFIDNHEAQWNAIHDYLLQE